MEGVHQERGPIVKFGDELTISFIYPYSVKDNQTLPTFKEPTLKLGTLKVRQSLIIVQIKN